ncbi:hypothetical protein [Ensifer sp. B1-9]|uniref:hypothetical protein n=1 Tax=Ensifer sp. B1-9 TaxID=3141455 RepID=UPI003D241FCF
MIRINKRGYDASGVKPGRAAFGGEPDDGLYETGARSTTALELRDFGEEANSRLPNWGTQRGRDKGVEVADTYIMSNTNPTGYPGLGDNMHSGLFIIPRGGEAEDRLLYDPAGSYMSREMGSGRALYGPEVNPEDYLRYQLHDGPNVTVRRYATTPEEEELIKERVFNLGGAPAANLIDTGCTTGVTEAIKGIGPFGQVEQTMWPTKLDEQLRRMDKHVGEANDVESLRRLLAR